MLITALGAGYGALIQYVGYPLFVLSVVFTIAHTLAEIYGGEEPVTKDNEPFWAYYGRVFGFKRLPDAIGKVLFAGLAITLISLAIGGYLYGSEFLLGGLIGARVGDALLSHIGLRIRFRGANPGLIASLLYLVEAFVVGLVVVGERGKILDVSLNGFVLGFSAFAVFWIVSFAVRFYRSTKNASRASTTATFSNT